MGETPVPIPNTMVKTQAADGTILETVWESRWLPEPKWGYSSVGRAPALQAGGQGFESLYLHGGNFQSRPWIVKPGEEESLLSDERGFTRQRGYSENIRDE